MGKEGFIIELTNKSEKEAIKEIKRIYKGGDLEKLTVKLRYK